MIRHLRGRWLVRIDIWWLPWKISYCFLSVTGIESYIFEVGEENVYIQLKWISLKA